MKLEEVKNNRFEPFTIKITIENEDELKEFWCRLNTAVANIKELNKEYSYSNFVSDGNNYLFDLIDSKMIG